MAIYPKMVNFGQLTSNFKKSLRERTGINNFNSDSTARSIYLPFVNELNRINGENRRAFESLQIDTARGKDLEAIAANYGLSRLTARYAETSAFDKNFVFSCESTFGEINSGNPIQIPAGTKIRMNEGTSNSVVYEVVSPLLLAPGNSYQYADVRSLSAGSNSNVAANTLVVLDFSNYTNSASKALKCTNAYAILNGRNNESDESLRFRIVNQYASIVKDSEDSLFLRSLEVPGALDIRIMPNYYGIGTVGVFVFGSGYKSNASLLAEVKRKINTIAAPGVRYEVVPGITVYLDIEISVYVNEAVTSEQQEIVRKSIERSLRLAINSENTSQQISISGLKDVIVNAHPAIKGILAKDGSSNLFRSVFIRKVYGEQRTTSERYSVNNGFISADPEEYFNLGSLNIEFEVYNK
tara:strand:- start:5570 stop:6802 length:1233 start_codon:yes stop_codon:yes gene_type:complete